MKKVFLPKKRIISIEEINQSYKFTEQIISSLSPEALNELFSGNETDIDKILKVLTDETLKAFSCKVKPIKNLTFDYLQYLTKDVEEELRCISLNYFVISCLSGFDVSWHHIEWFNLIQLHRFLCILAARDHGKSHAFSFAYLLWKMYQHKPNTPSARLTKLGMLITNRFKLSRHLLKFIREEVEGNNILRERLYPGKIGWGEDGVTCLNGAMLMLGAFDSSLRGFHPGYIVVDDFLNKSALYSLEQREKFEEVFHSEIMNMVLKAGEVKVIGTPFHEKDLYGNLKVNPKWRVFEYPGVFPNGKLLWEDRWTLQDLLDKKDSQGSIKFSREILVTPVSDANSIFPYEIIRKAFVGMDDYIMTPNIFSFKKKFVKIGVGCDFAISEKMDADYTVYTIIGIDELDNYWLLWYWREKGVHYSKQIAMLKQIKANFLPDVIMAEANAFQKVMIDLANDSNLNVVPHTTGTNKFDLDKGLPGLAILFEQSRMKFPRGDAQSRDMTDVVASELSSITWTDKNRLASISENDDTVYSLWLAILACKYVNESFSFDFL